MHNAALPIFRSCGVFPPVHSKQLFMTHFDCVIPQAADDLCVVVLQAVDALAGLAPTVDAL